MTQFSLGDAARILKVSPARLRYWQRTALTPPGTGAPSGGHVDVDGASPRPPQDGYEFRDLVSARAVLTLLDSGLPLRRIRNSVDTLRRQVPEIGDPLTQLRLWTEGSHRVVVRHGGVLLEPGGQLVLDFGDSDPTPEASPAVSSIESARGPATDPASLDRAIELFEEGCGLDSDPATYAQAIALYEASIAADPSFADSHCNLGAVLYNQGHRAPARASFERCLACAPGHVEARFNLANLLEEEGSHEMALEHYRAALESDPLYADLHVNLALLYERLERGRLSRDHWRLYLQLEPQGSWAEVARTRIDAAARKPADQGTGEQS